MTIKVEINGQPFEIEIPAGHNLEIAGGKLSVTKAVSAWEAAMDSYRHQQQALWQQQYNTLRLEDQLVQNGTVWISPLHRNIS